MRTTHNPLARFVPSLALVFGLGACSKDSPQDICDCLDRASTDYMAQHPDLTKAKLEEDGREIMQEMSKPCEEMGKAIMTKVEGESATKQAEAQQLIQNCLNAIGEKMKTAAKDDPATEDETSDTQSQEDDADNKADAAEDEADAKADAAEDEASTDEASTTDATDVDALLDDYEEAMQAYLRFTKKAVAGDASVAADYAEAYQKAEEVSQELTPAQKQMTPKQVQRFARIQAQLMQASIKMAQAMK